MKPLYEARPAGAAIFQSETLGAFWQKPRIHVKSATRPQVRHHHNRGTPPGDRLGLTDGGDKRYRQSNRDSAVRPSAYVPIRTTIGAADDLIMLEYGV